MSDFKREDRYRVYKLTDIEAAKKAHPRNADDIDGALILLDYTTSLARYTVEKKPLTCCVVEADWRCYEDVWSLVEAEHEENAWAGAADDVALAAEKEIIVQCPECGGEQRFQIFLREVATSLRRYSNET